jgi:hypothetical protein
MSNSLDIVPSALVAMARGGHVDSQRSPSLAQTSFAYPCHKPTIRLTDRTRGVGGEHPVVSTTCLEPHTENQLRFFVTGTSFLIMMESICVTVFKFMTLQ